MICPICQNSVDRVEIYGAGASVIRCCTDCFLTVDIDLLEKLVMEQEG